MKNESVQNDCLALCVGVAAFLGLLVSVSGCGVMGVREADFWGAKFTFAEGVDFHMGANSIDHVDDKRGVSPVASYRDNRRELADKKY